MALPTSLDSINAMMYALDRIRKERCEDAMSKQSGIEYVSEPNKRMYPCSSTLKHCEHGKCKIVSKELCEDKSQIPFDLISGDVIPGSKKCTINDDCADNEMCSSKKCVVVKPYLEFRDGKCLYGNSSLRKWCSYPTHRRLKPTKGTTDVPPFNYDVNQGKCLITKSYCDWMRTSYKIDEKGRPTCYDTTGQKIGQFFLGKTLFRDLKITKTVVTPNFAGYGVNLYLQNSRLGFSADEVESAYPELVDKKTKELTFNSDDLKDNNKKRIVFLSKHTDWISPSIIKAAAKKIKQ